MKIDNEIIKLLENKPKQLDFKALIKFMIESDIQFKNENLISSVGIATLDNILIDINKITRYSDSLIYFIILHEIGHYKRITKLGREQIISNLSIMDFDNFTNSIVTEEMIADRYASFVFLKLNGLPFPRIQTQSLELEVNKMKYRLKTARYFGVIKNSEENYYKLINQFVL